jgi:hypothetical protein
MTEGGKNLQVDGWRCVKVFSNNSYRLSSKMFRSTINIGRILKGGLKPLGDNLSAVNLKILVIVNDCNRFRVYQTTIPHTVYLLNCPDNGE